jgi:1,5-anhydro-D-fructose reductase (1,5-anhydro-D-mannitol-forming)
LVTGPAAVLAWGIAGYGWVARDHVAPAMRAAVNARLVAVCDPDPVARADAERLPGGGVRAHADLAALLAQPGIDAVYVATPNHLHRPLVEAAATAGKHVLCEKPMAGSLADAEAMAAACRRAGVRYATAFDQRFHPAHRRARALVAAGAVGTVTAVRVVYACWVGPDWSEDNWRVDAARAGGGALIDLAPHGLDLAAFLLGEPLVEVAAMGQRRVHAYGVEDGAVIVGRSAGGALLQMHVAYNCPEGLPRRRLEVVGTGGQLVATDTMGQTAGGHLAVLDPRTGAARRVAYEDADRSPFLGLIEDFSAATVAGEPDALDADLHAMRLLDRLTAAVARAPTEDRA